MNETCTQWFPANIKPVHVGEYEIHDSFCNISYWDGYRWSVGFTHNQNVLWIQLARRSISADQNKIWRGLAIKPKE